MEIWQNIPGTNFIYQASNNGNIRSIDRYVKHNYGGQKLMKGRVMKLSKQSNGYLACSIFFDGKEKRCSVHRLVMQAFHGQSDLTVNHRNGIKHDNRLSNLEYCTISENIKHSFKIGLSNIDGENHPSSKLTNAQVREILAKVKSGAKTSTLAKDYNVCQSAISNIKAGRSYAKCH